MAEILLGLIATVLHAICMFAAAPLLAGLTAKCRARLRGERGAPVLQPYHRLAKHLRTTPLIPDTATELYPAWPYMHFAMIAAAAMLVPGFATGMLTAPASDIFTFLGLLLLGRAAAWLAALETGFALSGAAASRDLTFATAALAAILPLLLAFALSAHAPGIDAMAQNLGGPALPRIIAAAALLLLTAAAKLALPVSSALAPEYSGRYLCLWEYGAMLQTIIWLTLLGTIICPYQIGGAANIFTWPGGLLLWVAKITILALASAVLTTTLPQLASRRALELLGISAMLGALACMLLFTAGWAP